MQRNIEDLQKEIERLNQIVEAYDKFRELAHKELKESKKIIQAYEEVQELNRVEQLALYDKLYYHNERFDLEEKIKKLLDENPPKRRQSNRNLKARRTHKPKNLFDSFLYSNPP
jgi:outer membrane protein assembly factor BamD (BamD/ComL family)